MQTKLRVVRALTGQTQEAFAKALATPLRTYSGYESGARPIPYRSWQYLNDRLREIVGEVQLEETRRRALFKEEYGRMNPIPE